MNFKEFGHANAESIVFLHGGGVSGWAWRLQIATLEQEFHCIVPDLPGHGLSLEPFTIKGAALEVANLIRAQVHDARAHLVGLSLGGQVGVQLLADHPELVNRAVLSGVLVRPAPGSSLVLNPRWRGLTRATLATYMPFRNAPWLVRANMRFLGVPEQFAPEFALDTQRLTLDRFMEIMLENLAFRLQDLRTNTPTIVLIGERELRVMHDSARDLTQALTNSSGQIAAKAGHNWNLEQPELFTDTVRAWVHSQDLPAGLIPF
jgi:pimeloyl-ACP methyl ester carboxylesterase